MGFGASKNKQTKPSQENRRQSSSTRNNKQDISGSESGSSDEEASLSERSDASNRASETRNSAQSYHSRQTSSHSSRSPSVPTTLPKIQNRSSSIPSEKRSVRKLSVLPNGTEPLSSFNQQNINNGHHVNGQLDRTNDLGRRSKTNLSNLPGVISPPPTNTNLVSNNVVSGSRRTSLTSVQHTGRCSLCPHCQRIPKANLNKTPSPPPAWIIKANQNDNHHINMDNYDEVAMKRKKMTQYGHYPGSYDYPPNLIIEEPEDQEQMSNKYYTLPIIANVKSSISPVRTPFPNYSALQRREQRLNKPYTSALFTD